MATEQKTVELVVPDLCCVECSQGVVTTLRRTPGVQDLQVLGLSEKVLVTYDETATHLEKLIQAVEQAGHQVTGWKGEDTEEPSMLPEGEARSRRVQTFALLRLAFVGVISLIALVEITGESLGLLHGIEELVPPPLALAVALLGGYPIFRGAWLGLRQRRINTDAVMSVGILAAAAIGQFISSALIVFFVIIAHYLEDKTTGQARRAIAELAELAPKTARVKRGTDVEEVPVSALKPGDLVVVRQGEHVPFDGSLARGHATSNQAPITGESMPVEKQEGDEVFAATIVQQGYLEKRRANPASPSASPSTTPSTAAEAPRTLTTRLANKAVGTSGPMSARKLAMPMPRTPGVNHFGGASGVVVSDVGSPWAIAFPVLASDILNV